MSQVADSAGDLRPPDVATEDAAAQSAFAALGGLTSSEAAERRAVFGPNEAVRVRHWSWLRQLARQFSNPLVLILLVASLISAIVGDLADAALIALIVLTGGAIGFVQGYRSQAAARRLHSLVAPTASVRRDGEWTDALVRDLVPGDVVRLAAGDLVPADGRLFESRDLAVQQATLTGESLPVDKCARPDVRTAGGQPDDPHLVFQGTSVVSGTGTMVVDATGVHTMFGGIAARLAARAPETEFERGMRRFSLLILTTTTALLLFIAIVSIAFGRDPFQSLLFAVALGVGLTPEFLPMIVSVTLTAGALGMARDKVIVKHLPAMQNFGAIDVFCSDKTGTLTTGVLEVDRAFDLGGQSSAQVLELAATVARHSTGIRGPFDVATLTAAPADIGRRKLDEIPFDFERRRSAVVVADADGHPLLIVRGAPESVLHVCDLSQTNAGISRLDDASRASGLQMATELGACGIRVLAVATRPLPVQSAYSRVDERELTLRGFVAFRDPPRDDAADAIADLARAQVSVKILTGDSAAVAAHVCQSIGLTVGAIVTGDDLQDADDAALGAIVEQHVVFARVAPAQKNRIIRALQRRGHVVGYLGDGINDAPALHSADVGISVMSGVDVARDAAGIILGEPSLRVLHTGIVEGRRASANVMKYLLMGTSSNFGNMASMAVASLFLPFLPMLPTQILLNNFLYDLAQVAIPTDRVDAAVLRRPQRWNMAVIRDFMLVLGPVSSCFDLLTFYVLVHVFRAHERLFHTGWFIESLATQTLVLFVIRTMGSPLASRPSRALLWTTIAMAGCAFLLPLTPLAGPLRFVRPPASFFAFVAAATAAYLALADVIKRRLVRRLISAPARS